MKERKLAVALAAVLNKLAAEGLAVSNWYIPARRPTRSRERKKAPRKTPRATRA